MKLIRQITLVLFSAVFIVIESNAQTLGGRFNYTQGTVELKNGTIQQGDVANIKHGFRDELVNGVRVRLAGTGRVKKYRPREIKGYTMDNRKFVSWPAEKNDALLKEMYTINAGHEYQVFELQKEGHLSIYLQYFLDDDLQIHTAPFFLKKGELVLVRATQGLFGLKYKLLSDYFKDCPPLVELLENKKLTTPEEVADFYNNYKFKSE